MTFLKQNRNLICVSCPMGCSLTVVCDGDSIESVKGNRCLKGITYAESEIRDPKRMLSATVRINGGILPLVPVHTLNPVPKEDLLGLLEQLKLISLQAPVKMGQVILKDACGTGVDVVASRDLPLWRASSLP